MLKTQICVTRPQYVKSASQCTQETSQVWCLGYTLNEMITSQQKRSYYFLSEILLDISAYINFSDGTQNINSSFVQRTASFLYLLCYVSCFPFRVSHKKDVRIPNNSYTWHPPCKSNHTWFCRPNITGSRSRWQRGLRCGFWGRSRAGIAGSNSAGGLNFYLLGFLCVVRWKADHPPRGVLRGVERLSVIMRHVREDHDPELGRSATE